MIINAHNFSSTFNPTATWGKFDGTDDYVRVADSNSLTPSSGLTVSFWVKYVTLARTDGLVSKASGEWAIGKYADSKIYAVVGPSGAFIGRTAPAPSINVWHHIAYTWSGGSTAASIKIYSDSVAIDNANYTSGTFSGVSNTTVDMLIGRDTWLVGGYLNGRMADVRYYDYGLSSSEILWLYSGGVSGVAPSSAAQKAHYLFNETSGTNVADSSGVGNTGTATNITPASFWSA